MFDLDGTLSESAPGMTKCVQYALHCIGIEEPDPENLRSFIGPPLNVEFKRRYGLSPDQIETAVIRYREKYAAGGMYDCRMYEGTEKMLKDCVDAGLTLAVSSSKPQPFVEAILDRFGIRKYFSVIFGSAPEEEISRAEADQKTFIVRQTLEALAGARGESADEILSVSAMVGDRCYDMKGAIANGVHAVGVSFGYGSEEELRSSGAEYIAASPAQLSQILCGCRG